MTTHFTSAGTGRIHVVDALRGFAIMSIMLLHNIEHFDFYYFPQNLPEWMKMLDGIIWKVMFFLFSGKSYAIFAILFGLTFYIMFSNQAKKGRDFRWRFLWRMFILLVFGIINSVFYEGDILAFYAVLSVVLVLTARWSDKAVMAFAVLLLLQPLEWLKLAGIMNDPGYVDPGFLSYKYFEKAAPYVTGKSFIDLAVGNLTNGRWAVVLWNNEAGRYFQTPALFLFGMLIGRKKLFIYNEANLKFWKRALWASVVAFIVCFSFKLTMPQIILREVVRTKLDMIITTYSNFAFTMLMVSSFVLIYRIAKVNAVLGRLEPFGRMSLTNYITQSMLGAVVYYGFGFGLYRYTGATYSLLVGILLFLLQYRFCMWWMKNHARGPLEELWHRITWIGVR